MPTPTPSDPQPSGKDPKVADPAVAPVVPSTEENLRRFWEKNSLTVYSFCVVVVLAIAGRAAYNVYLEHRHDELSAEYKAADKDGQLPSFISAHPGEPLAGIAAINLADEAYKAAKYSEALDQYQRGADTLKTGPLAGRALLGAATCDIYLNKVDAGLEKLRQLSNDGNQLKSIRAEASFKVASLAAESGKTEEALKYLDLTNTIDPASSWAQQSLALRSTLPVPAAAAKPTDAATPTVSLKLPAKP